MKKITLLLTLLLTSMGFSQTIPVTFQSDITNGAKSNGTVTPANANWYSDSGLTSTTVEDLASDTPDHMNAGKIISSSTGQKWQNAQLLMTNNYMDLTTNKTITLDVYSDNAQDFLLKVEESLGTGANSEKSFSHQGSGWETIMVDFTTPNSGQPVPNDQYKLLVIFPCYSPNFVNAAFDSTTYVDNISTAIGNAITAPAVPSSGAPAPTNTAADVYSLFGDTYTNTAPSSYSQNWGQGTVSDYTAGSDDIDEFPNTNDSEFEVQSSTTQSAEAWVGHDFAIADFTGLTGTANLGQIQVLLGSATGGTMGDAYIDNIYFWKAPTAGVDDFFANAVKLHPNPAYGVVNISTPTNAALEVSVHDLLGKLVIPVQTIQSQLNISSLNPGMHFVNMKQGTNTATKKLLVN